MADIFLLSQMPGNRKASLVPEESIILTNSSVAQTIQYELYRWAGRVRQGKNHYRQKIEEGICTEIYQQRKMH